MIPVSAIIAFLLLGIEEIGVQIEEPFGILPLGQKIACHVMFLLCEAAYHVFVAHTACDAG